MKINKEDRGKQNINAMQVQNKNESTKRYSEKHTPPMSNKNIQKAHEDIDILGIQDIDILSIKAYIDSEFGKLDVVAFSNSENMQIENSRDATARKFPNKIELLSAALIDVRADIVFDIDPIGDITEYSRCPEIDILLNGKLVNLLIDTGSEFTVISEKFYNDNLEYFMSDFTSMRKID